MFPSSSNCDLFPFSNQPILASSFTDNENPTSSREHHSSPFLHFSEPFLADDNELLMSQFLPQQQILCSGSNLDAETEIKMASPMKAAKKTTRKKKSASGENNGDKQAIPRKRVGKKDRHSKIYTAQGPRDRRMRLSLQIARKFFDLQDMLGFDKASKTIEWLFSKSKAAIKELTESLPGLNHSCSGGGKSLSSTSESEVVSGLKKTDSGGALTIGDSLVGTPKEAKNKKSDKTKQSRDKARARARERTKEKMRSRGLEKSKHCCDEANPNDLEPLGSSSPLQTAENFCPSSQEMNSSLKVVAEEESGTVHLQQHEMDSVSIIEKFLGITPAQGSSSTFSCSHNIAESSARNFQQKNAVFTGNWDHTNNDTVQYTYCAVTNMKGLTGNLQVQNPSVIYKINQDDQDKKSSSIYMTTANAHDRNPNSIFMAPSNAHEQNPSSVLMTTSNIDSQTHLLENQFSCNPTVSNKYYNLY